MSKFEKLIKKILNGSSDANIEFDELVNLLHRLGFDERQRGTSHKIFFKDGVAEMINIQPIGSKAKPYQVKQVREIINKYKLND
ncbi:type II toxin-antitoxin system HicA family toxin [Adhaeribacter pallidiroseus]|uniref:Toxin HicA n=1 Tax=Adhaeribacter pallidiroseus TaxID=2072847 RepID=A0A369QG48_9BACT|nr:type II toxin-antitoxin system HicA family toxin [Adhaeribacter pallidiroseus]RDC63270.1 hypothetical protein AHMF7616_01872 [Adhaeribacter pallidiroseus]